MGNKSGYAQNFKSGDLVLNVSLLNLFSSRMKTQEQNDMMHYLYMMGQRWGGYRNFSTNDRMLRYKRLQRYFFMDTFFAWKDFGKSTRNYQVAQLFV